jgi:N-methylhydantoinase A/oxoprolinase/acetone carboxylase beta subunit
MAPLDETLVAQAALALKQDGIKAIAISCAFAPLNADMEQRAAAIVREVHPQAVITLSSAIGRAGFIERENSAILNAALTSLSENVVESFERAVCAIGIAAPLFISQNDGTLTSAAQARAYPVTTMGSGPTNSMRGAAFLSGVSDAIVMDVGGTSTDLGVLTKGYPRESSISVDIGGVRTNFRMPDILALALGGGTRIHLDPSLYEAASIADADLRLGPDSVGYRLTHEAMLFGGNTLTTSDIAVRAGKAEFGDATRLPIMSQGVASAIETRMRAMLEDAVDRMKITADNATILAVGGGNFLIPDTLGGAAKIVRPPHATVANAVGAAIAQVGAHVERVVNYETISREAAIEEVTALAREKVMQAGGDPTKCDVVEVEETYLGYMPGRSVQLRVRVVSDLILSSPALAGQPIGVHHAA